MRICALRQSLYAIVSLVIIWQKKTGIIIRKDGSNIGCTLYVEDYYRKYESGYSVENAFREAGRDIALLYGKKSHISRYMDKVYKGLRNNVPLEKLLLDFGKKCGNADIEEFAGVFAIAKRSGGNMTETIDRTISVISRKMDVEKEIEVLISAKRLEARIMNFVPFFIIFYISITSPGFFAPLYHNIPGVILMTICMFVYFAAYLLSEKIVNITI